MARPPKYAGMGLDLMTTMRVVEEVSIADASAGWCAAIGSGSIGTLQLRDDVHPSVDIEKSLLEESAKHIARYKLPKAFIFVDTVVRSPAGKADYRWAKETAVGSVDGLGLLH